MREVGFPLWLFRSLPPSVEVQRITTVPLWVKRGEPGLGHAAAFWRRSPPPLELRLGSSERRINARLDRLSLELVYVEMMVETPLFK